MEGFRKFFAEPASEHAFVLREGAVEAKPGAERSGLATQTMAFRLPGGGGRR